jgi:hypothetical protein
MAEAREYRDPDQKEADVAPEVSTGKNETFAFLPDWLFGTWTDRGALGLWEPRLSTDLHPRQVGLGSGFRGAAGEGSPRPYAACPEW